MIEVLITAMAVVVFGIGAVVVALVWDMTKVYRRVQDLENRGE